VADVVEAMASHRRFRPGLGIEKALSEIEQGSGHFLDPEFVQASQRLFQAGFSFSYRSTNVGFCEHEDVVNVRLLLAESDGWTVLPLCCRWPHAPKFEGQLTVAATARRSNITCMTSSSTQRLAKCLLISLPAHAYPPVIAAH
jgi:hypothetical protein